MSSKFQLMLVFTSSLAFLFAFIAFCCPTWIETREGNNHFQRAGLWVFCFREFHDPTYRFPTIIFGCLHVFNERWWHLRDILLQRFFQTVQATFTVAFILITAGCSAVVLRQSRFIEPTPLHLFTLGLLHFTSGIFTTISVLIFAAYGDGRDWMPDWRRNYISWAFASAVISAVLEYYTSVMLCIYSVHIRRNMGHMRLRKARLEAKITNVKTEIFNARNGKSSSRLISCRTISVPELQERNPLL